MGARPARAYLAIDWLSCHSEVVSDGEGGLHVTGREICQLMDVAPWGIIYREEPPGPVVDRQCDAKDKKARKAMEEAKKRLAEKPDCAAALNGTNATASDTVTAVHDNNQYNACVGPAPNGQAKAAASDPSTGTNTNIKFYDAFYGSLGQYDYLGQLNNDGLRRQMVVLHELAHATGKVPTDDAQAEATLNQAILDKCFGPGDKGNPTDETVDEDGIGVYTDATAASTDANDGVLGDDGSGDPADQDVFIADPEGETVPGSGGGGGDDGAGGGGGHELNQ
jgi:hypothetical protein